MHYLDWIVLFGTLGFIVVYGVLKSDQNKSIESYLLAGKDMKWWSIGLSVMATQASAITFLSTPGQAYEEGMGFVQFYFGMPIALILICAFVIPFYFRLKVYTAYEFLETRFGLETRWLAAFLFLVSRGLSAGITIYAPAIVLSSIMKWDLNLTILIIGTLVIIYTVAGGSKAVAKTHKLQMAVMMGGMVLALILLFRYLSDYMTPGEAVQLAGKMGKMNIVDTTFDPSTKYNLWSGLIGGLFLSLSYFGTDQSQVQRYLSGKNMTEMRLGLLFNSVFKIPMQLLILFIGVMVFVFYQYNDHPVFFNPVPLEEIRQSEFKEQLLFVEEEHQSISNEKKEVVNALLEGIRHKDEQKIALSQETLEAITVREQDNRKEVVALIQKATPDAETKDGDYIFINFVTRYLPIGIIGLLLAVIFSGAMSSTSAELNALSSTTTVDFYKRVINKNASEVHYLNFSRWITLLWGLLAIAFAMAATLFDNLIELVNILGSLFYGTILGIFLIAFFIPYLKGTAVFIAGIISEIVIISLFFLNQNGIIQLGYLWYNLIGPAVVITLAFIFQRVLFGKRRA